jgi:hypothetical protein
MLLPGAAGAVPAKLAKLERRVADFVELFGPFTTRQCAHYFPFHVPSLLRLAPTKYNRRLLY